MRPTTLVNERIARRQGKPVEVAPGWLTWGVGLSSAWFGTGLYLDGWAHTNALPDTFFPPWHGVIYSGFLVAALFLGIAFLRRRRSGMPTGYGLSLVGVGLFLLGGVADLIWHTFLGIEANLAAEYNPPHLVLATAGLLIATGPLRAAWAKARRDGSSTWSAILSLALLLSIFTFFTSDFHPFDHPWAWNRFRPLEISNLGLGLPSFGNGSVSTQDLAQAVGTISILLQSSLLVALLLLMIRHFGARLPFGWLTFVFALNGAAMSIPHDDPWVFPLAIVAGLTADVLYRLLQPEIQRYTRLCLFAVLVPIGLYSLYASFTRAPGRRVVASPTVEGSHCAFWYCRMACQLCGCAPSFAERGRPLNNSLNVEPEPAQRAGDESAQDDTMSLSPTFFWWCERCKKLI